MNMTKNPQIMIQTMLIEYILWTTRSYTSGMVILLGSSPPLVGSPEGVVSVFDTGLTPYGHPYLVLTYGINYNQTWHQSGAVGRFFTLGAKYSF